VVESQREREKEREKEKERERERKREQRRRRRKTVERGRREKLKRKETHSSVVSVALSVALERLGEGARTLRADVIATDSVRAFAGGGASEHTMLIASEKRTERR
jgi:hypothetical protein